jgi:hypothetical protein
MVEKRAIVKLLGDAKEAYLQLEENSAEEMSKGITNSFHQTLLKSINSKIAILKKDLGVLMF